MNLKVDGDVDGDSYRQLLRWASTNLSLGLLVRRPGLDLSPDGHRVFERLEPFTTSRETMSAWPGTQLLEGEAEVTVFRLSAEAVKVLDGAASSLLEWQQPALPEDLCFLHQDGEPALTSTTHEGLVTLHLSLSELEDLKSSVPAIARMLVTSSDVE